MPINLQQLRDLASDDAESKQGTSDSSSRSAEAQHLSIMDKIPILQSMMSDHEHDHDMDLDEVEDDVPDSLKELHPYAQVLTLNDVESCVALENATFSEETKCTREKFVYRFNKASELSLGLFTSATLDNVAELNASTAATANAIDSNEPHRKAILLAHVIATKTTNELVRDEDMAMPQNPSEVGKIGHIEYGNTIALHSLAVLPSYQKRGIGSMLMKAYIQRMVESGTADRISLLAHDHLVEFYENLGFENKGKGGCKHGGEDWVDMTIDFSEIRGESEEEESE